MPFLYKKFFENVPVNNITLFKSASGVNQIQFLIPAVNGALLSTNDLMFSGNIQVNADKTNPLTVPAAARTAGTGISLDTVIGIHNIIDRVEIVSARGNTLIEQRQNYQLITKYGRGVQAESNLQVGRFNNQQLCSSSVRQCREFCGRNAFADDGQDFAVQLNTGLLRENDQQLNLQALGGLKIKIFLSEGINAFFNIDKTDTNGTSAVIGQEFNYSLSNVKLFGRYNYATPDMISSLTSVSYRKTTDLPSVIQSSNDTITGQPQVNSLHKMIYVYQPNDDVSNDGDVNNMACNMIVDLNKYLLSMNGVRTPLDYSVDINPRISALPANTGVDSRVSGNAEQQYLAISALNDQFPPTHSLSNAKNQAAGLNNQLADRTTNTLNVNVIGMNYSFNFSGYNVAVPNDLMSINVESGVLTNNNNLPDGTANNPPYAQNSRDIRGQRATQQLFYEYGATLNYSSMASQM
jgi:hypothetical protein